MEETKVCNHCNLTKNVSEFKTRKSNYRRNDGTIHHREWVGAWCKNCVKIRHNELYKKNHSKTVHKKWVQQKEIFFRMYGEMCDCCGESIREFLTADHVLGQIGKKKKDGGGKAYREAIKEYRPDLYRTLCHNCNNTIGRLGYCPHHPERKAEYVPLYSGRF